jgi:hypothetical protein
MYRLGNVTVSRKRQAWCSEHDQTSRSHFLFLSAESTAFQTETLLMPVGFLVCSGGWSTTLWCSRVSSDQVNHKEAHGLPTNSMT